MPEPSEFMTRQEAAKMLGVSLMTIDRYANDGQLTRHKKPDRSVWFLRTEVVELATPKPVVP